MAAPVAPARGLGSESAVGRRPSRLRGHALLAVIVVAIVVIAAVGSLAYWWSTLQTQSVPPTRYGGLMPINVASVTATGDTNGPGGCSAPGVGHTEYCYIFGLAFLPGSLAVALGAGDASVIYETTADVSFLVQSIYTGANLTFANVTLLNGFGRILATFTPGSGWSPFDGGTLPIVLWTNQTCVLNVGLTPAAGDNLRFEQGAWGTAIVALP